MASRQQIKRRISSVKSTKQITKAMQLVAASKLRRAQEAALGPQEYSRVAREMLTRLRQLAATEPTVQLFKQRPVKRRLLVAITSDRTLAGAYNVNVIRQMINELKHDRANNVATEVITIGRQAANAAARIQGLQVAGVYTNFPERPSANDIRPILTTAVDRFQSGEIDDVSLIYTHFASTVSQQVKVRQLLPAGFEEEPLNNDIMHATIEPSVEELLRSTAMRLLEVQLYQALLESVASEHSMRMLAMKNATDNASDLIDDYTLEYNNARQAAITQELAEISGGAEAMNG
jgi:F-type H+-transporting ATPase subunit gamma